MRCLTLKRNVRTTSVMSVKHWWGLRTQRERFIKLNELVASLLVLDVQKHSQDKIHWICIGMFVWWRMELKVINLRKMKTDFIVDVDVEDLVVQYLRYDGNYNLAVCIECEYALPITGPYCGEVSVRRALVLFCVWKSGPFQLHSGEGKSGRVHLIKTERRGYKKIPLVGFQDIYKTDLENSFRPNRVILRGVLPLGTQIPSGT